MAAIEAARQNAGRNGVEGAFERLNLREQVPPVAPTVVANITAPLLLELAARIASGEIERPRTLVLSGILRTEVDRVAGAYAGAGLGEGSRRESGDWAALLLRG